MSDKDPFGFNVGICLKQNKRYLSIWIPLVEVCEVYFFESLIMAELSQKVHDRQVLFRSAHKRLFFFFVQSLIVFGAESY